MRPFCRTDVKQPYDKPDIKDEQNAPAGSLLFLVLFCSCAMSISPHYGKHSLSSLAPSLLTNFKIERTTFGLLFTVQELAGIVLPIISGAFLSYLPYGWMAVVLTSCMAFGQFLCATASDSSSITLMYAGRFFFGIGDSCLVMLHGSIIARWFRYSYISMAYGIMLLCSRLGSFSGLAIPGLLDLHFGLSFAMWFAFFVALMSVGASISYLLLETMFWKPEAESEGLLQPSSRVRISFRAAASSLSQAFFLLALLWALLASPFFSLLDFFTDIYTTRSNASAAHSGVISGTILGLAAVLSPIFGLAIDKVGRRPFVLAIAMTLLSSGVLLLAMTTTTVVPLLMISIAFGLGPVTLLSCVALVVPSNLMPLALGIYKTSQNVGLASTHFLAGLIRDKTGDYHAVLLLFSFIAASGVIPSVLLYLQDQKNAKLLSECGRARV